VAVSAAFTLLYVDDQPMSVELLAGVLQMRPEWRMVAATNGRAAMAMAVAQPLNLLLLEQQLGDMSGLELLRRLRRIPRLAGVPCLMLSTDTATTARTSQDGVLGCWTKPLDVPRLLQLLDAVAQR
jgi:CheY-like chemotaxis protein